MLRWLPVYCRLAGAVDITTGLLLVAAPATTLRLMGATRPVGDLMWVRWVGVFVGSVGLLYWLPDLLSPSRQRQHRRLETLESTTVVRLAVASFVAWGLATGRLDLAFASVLATDLGLGLFQVFLLRKLLAETPA